MRILCPFDIDFSYQRVDDRIAMNEPPNAEVAIFAAALELPADQRAAYLDQACAGDAALRRQVEVLLRDHDDAGNFFDKLASVARPTSDEGAMPGLSGTNRVPGIPCEAGDRIGRYKLLQQIGEGGCGVVYMAEQEEPVRRQVALKVIKLGMDTKSVIARFEAERQTLALMDHPNIAKVLEAGATETGRPYFVMELVRGIKITDYCDQNNLSTRERLDLFIQVCQAIQHAHQKGIIHRDIKPSNILVADHDGVPVPKIIDFGIAKATTDQRLTDKTLFTAFEQFIGTPAYMSPEQAKLSGLNIDTRSDIYSLGVLLYELLTAKTPFEANRLLEAGLDEIRRIIREEEPVRPSTRLQTLDAAEQTKVARHRHSEPPKLLGVIRGDLDWIVMKCLEKDRARRYETANGLAMDIQRHLGNEPVLARPPSAAYRLQKAWRRHKGALALTALTAAVLVAATAISAWQAIRGNRQARRALQAESLANQRLADSEAISKFLIEVFRSPSPLRDGRTITVAETLSNATQKLGTDLTNQPARWAKLQSAIGESYFGLGLFHEAIPLEEKVRDYYLAASGPESLDTLVATRRVANLYAEVGRQDEAIKMLEQVLTLSRKTLGPEHPQTMSAMSVLAGTYDIAGRWNEAVKLREQSLELRRKVNGPENPITIEVMEDLATSYAELGRLHEAIPLGEQVLALSTKVLGPQSRQTGRCMFTLGASYYAAGRRDEALKLWEQALPLEEKVNGPEHPQTLKVMIFLAVAYDDLGRRDDALKLREQALAINRKINGPEHPDTIAAMQGLATSYDRAGQHDRALKLLQQAVDLSRTRVGAEHPLTLSMMGSLSFVSYEAGRLDEALKLGEEVLALNRKVLGVKHHDTLNAMENLAIFYDAVGRRDESLKLKEQILDLCLEALGPKNPGTLEATSELTKGYAEAGRQDEVLKLSEKTLALDRKALGPQDPVTLQAMNDLAWIQSTSDAAEIRNGTNAVLLAEEAVAATHRKNPGFLDTLAAAYAESQQFDKAAAVEQEAIGLLKSEQEKNDYAAHLRLYQANKPCRMKSNP
ncbi:Serine/threonine protein kinase with TPR repeats (fragment) [Verrucomicrobia bacterium]